MKDEKVFCTVSKAGDGDFTTVREAINSVPIDNKSEKIIFVKTGIYKEHLEIKTPFITLAGEDRENTVITYDLYANMVMEDGMKRGTFRSYSVLIDTDNFIARDITFENSSGRGDTVGQALALYVDGDRITFENCKMLGSQDTLFTAPLPQKEMQKNGFIGPKQFAPRKNGRHLYSNCYIEGDVDFIFGGATAFFEECELFSLNRDECKEQREKVKKQQNDSDFETNINGYVTAASTPEAQKYGYVFWNCKFTSNCPRHTVYLGRPWRNFAKTVIINSYIGEHICEEGWHDWGKTAAHDTVFYAEAGNYGPSARLDRRPDWVKRLHEDDLEQYSKKNVLGLV